MVKFRWESDVNNVAGVATFFPDTPSPVRLRMLDFRSAHKLHSAFEAEIRRAERRARSELADEITEKYGAV